MCLQNNLSSNPFNEEDLMGRNVLWEWINNGEKEEEMFSDTRLRIAVEQFSWFHSTQQKVLYNELNMKKISNLTKYLKETTYNK